MTEVLCRCGKLTAGAHLCPDCTRTLAYAIANTAGHYDDLGTVARRQTRYGDGGNTKGSIGKTQPLPVDMRFISGPPEAAHRNASMGPLTQLRWDAWNTITAWARTVMAEQPQMLGPTCAGPCLHTSCAVARTRRWPTNTVVSMCHYLDRQHRWIHSREWAPNLLDELLDLEHRLTRAVNRPAERWYAGKCSAPRPDNTLCTAELYATQDRGHVTCRTCDTTHDVDQRRDFLLDEAKHILVTATEAAGALLAWTDYNGNEANLIKLIAKWSATNRLQVRGHVVIAGRDRRLYRLGDVQQLLVRHAQSEQARKRVS